MYKVSKSIAFELDRPLVHLVFNNTKTASLFGSKICNLVPHKIKQKEPAAVFENSTMAWNPRNCSCCLCEKCCQHWIYLNYDFLGLTNLNKKFILPWVQLCKQCRHKEERKTTFEFFWNSYLMIVYIFSFITINLINSLVFC